MRQVALNVSKLVTSDGAEKPSVAQPRSIAGGTGKPKGCSPSAGQIYVVVVRGITSKTLPYLTLT